MIPDEDCYLMWQYCKDLNDIDEAVKNHDENWEGLESLHQIKSITYDVNHGCYVVFWIAYRERQEEYGERARDALYRIIRHMPPTEPEQRWIPVSERLPDKSNFYICTKKNRLVKTVWYSVLKGAWEENVIAWMPVPEPYREEGE